MSSNSAFAVKNLLALLTSVIAGELRNLAECPQYSPIILTYIGGMHIAPRLVPTF